MEVIVKIEFGESVKNLFADLFKLVGQQPAVVVNNLPVSDGTIAGQIKAEDAPKAEEQPAKPAATRTRAKAAAKPAPEPVAEQPEAEQPEAEQPEAEPENIPELPEDEQELSDPEPVAEGPFVPRDKDGNELDHKKIQVLAMQKGLPAFRAALEMATGGTVKALRDLEGENMQRVYNFLMQQPNAK